MVKKWLIGILIAVVLVLIAPLAINLLIWTKIKVPPDEPVEVVWTDQNWKKEDWQWWYHATQGSALESIIPYKWFISLEQPKLSWWGSTDPFIDPKFLGGFGLLPDNKNADNPDSIPVGFAKTENYFDPQTGATDTVIGLTCAACHTAQINYQGKGIRVEGGPSMVNLKKFKTAFGLALFLTDLYPPRFNRFADKVLGENYTTEERKQLKQKLKSVIAQGKEFADEVKNLYPTEEGFARLDALGRIGNFVFGRELNSENYRVADAPVNFPHIWSSSWFDWVQYNGSVMQPMARNAGEAMGVFSRVNLDPNSPHSQVFESNVNVEKLFEIEELLSGDSIFNGLIAPKWPEYILGEIDSDKAAQGKQLYQQNCQVCHLPPMDSEEFKADEYWTKLGETERQYLKVTMKNLYDIGTDPKQAVNWFQRTVNIDSLASKVGYESQDGEEDFETDGIVKAEFALKFAVDKTVEKKYDQLGLTQEQRYAYDGYRPDKIRSPLAYKARPLNGIWATAPFLHNGSVPNLYEMLLPAEQRSQKFYLGTKEFDPKYVGFQKDKIPGGFLLDTAITGNSNAGHQFKGDGTGEGVIGPELSEDERWALVEYLKTL
ncbi:MAG: cytochrome c [Symploca sp. SIO2B6]|nr:cytochrome c [Symploca sp. SIO2B6]